MKWFWGGVFGLGARGAYALYKGSTRRIPLVPWQQQLEQAGFGGSNLLGLLIFQGAMWKGWQSMITFLEVLAMVTLAGLGAVFFRRRIRRGSVLALVFAGFCTVLALPAPVTATEFRKGGTAEVRKDETVKGDIYMNGQHARIDGTVDGDAYVFCQQFDMNGHVTGDVIAFSQSSHIKGQIDGNLRSFNNNTTITGTVGKSAMLFNEVVTVDADAHIGRSFTVFAEGLNLDGNVGRDALLFFAHA